MAEPSETQTPEPSTGTEPKTFSQEEVEALGTKEKQRGERVGAQKAAEKLAEDLGMSVEDAKALIAEHKQREEQQKSEATKALEAKAQAEAERDSYKAQVAQVSHNALVEKRLLAAGVSSEQLDRMTSLVKVETGADASAIDEDIAQIKKDFAPLFESQPARRLPNSDPTGTPRSGATGESVVDRAKAIADAQMRERGLVKPA